MYFLFFPYLLLFIWCSCRAAAPQRWWWWRRRRWYWREEKKFSVTVTNNAWPLSSKEKFLRKESICGKGKSRMNCYESNTQVLFYFVEVIVFIYFCVSKSQCYHRHHHHFCRHSNSKHTTSIIILISKKKKNILRWVDFQFRFPKTRHVFVKYKLCECEEAR